MLCKFSFEKKKKKTKPIYQIFSFQNADSKKDSFRFLEEANKKSEFFSTKYMMFVLIGFFINTTMMSAVSVIFCQIFYGIFLPKHVYHPFQVLWVEIKLISKQDDILQKKNVITKITCLNKIKFFFSPKIFCENRNFLSIFFKFSHLLFFVKFCWFFLNEITHEFKKGFFC